MATLYEIISYAGLNPNIPQDSKTVIDILENSKEYTLYKKGLFGTLTVDGDAKEIANYVKKVRDLGTTEAYEEKVPFYYGQSGWGEELVFVKTMAQLCAVNTGKTHLGIGTVPRMNYGEKINVIVKPGEGFAIPSILENEMNRIQSSGVVPKIVDRISNELWAPLDEDEKIDICGGYLRAESADIMYHSAIIIAEDGIYFYKAYGDRPHLVSRWHDISFKSLGMRYLNENNMAYCLSIEIIKELLEKKSPDIPIDLSGFFAGSDIGNHYDNCFSVATPMGAGKLYTLVEFERNYYIRPASGLTEW